MNPSHLSFFRDYLSLPNTKSNFVKWNLDYYPLAIEQFQAVLGFMMILLWQPVKCWVTNVADQFCILLIA